MVRGVDIAITMVPLVLRDDMVPGVDIAITILVDRRVTWFEVWISQ